MTRAKTSSISNIIGNGIKIYILNLFTLTNPIILPIIAMIFGIGLMIVPLYLLPKYYPLWAENISILNEMYSVVTIAILSVIPGLILFKIGFWNYMLKLVSLNSMVGDILKKKVLKHNSYYTQIVSLRTKDYVLMLAIYCSIWIMGLSLPFSIYLFNIDPAFIGYFIIALESIAIFLLLILSLYLSLSFQVFAFETAFGPMQTLEESFKLVLNNFWRILILTITLIILTSLLVPQIFSFITDILLIKSTIALPLKEFLNGVFNNYPQFFEAIQNIPFFSAQTLKAENFIEELAKVMSFSIISSVISLLMLPLGSCLYTIFYFDAKKRRIAKIESEQTEPEVKEKKTAKKTKSKKQ